MLQGYPESFLGTDIIGRTEQGRGLYADNVELLAGGGGAILATDSIGVAPEVHHQLVKLEFGAADSATMVSAASPLPVTLISESLGTVLDVSLTTELPAGTQNIGDVDVLSVIPGAGATNLGKAEDAVHTTGDVGVMGLAVRTDTPANRSTTDGDYEPLQISAGRLWASVTVDAALPAGGNNIGDVDIASLPNEGQQNMAGSISVAIASDQSTIPVSDGGGVLTVDGSVSITGTATVQSDASQVDDAVFAPATGRVVMVGATFDDVTPDSVDEGDGGAMRMSANRNLYTQIRDLTAERSASVTAANALKVDNSAVTQPVSGTVTANAGTGSFITVGDIAHDAADSGAPVKVGAVGRTTNPTAVADGDRVNLFADDMGRLINYPFAPRDRIAKGARVTLTSTTETTILAAGGAGVFRDLVWLLLSNDSATEVSVSIRDVTAGTVLFTIDLAADGGGATVTLPIVWPQATAASAWTAQLSGAATSVYVSCLAVENN